MMRKQFLTVISALACASMVSTAQAQDKVRFVYTVQVHQANAMVLPDFSKKYGIDVEVVQMRRYADQQLALTTNQVDIAVLGYVNIGLMEEKGFRDYKAISGVFSRGQNLTLANGVDAKSWKDLEGRKLGTAPNSLAELLFKSTAKANGADITKITTVSFAAGGPPMLSALKSREIDGFVSWEPNNAEASLGKYGYYSSLDISANDTQGVNGLLAVNTAFAQKNHKAVVGFLKAFVEATNVLNGDKARYQTVAVQVTGSSPEVVKEAIPHGELDYKLYAKEARALLQLVQSAGIIQVDTVPAVDRQFDYSFLSEATGKPAAELGGG
jgi:ABC-type nitrate/sulfonate/bicarbonate transport system substrate-binding protein